jgi:uncharacterized protein
MGRLLFVLLLLVGIVLWWKLRQRGAAKPPSEAAKPSAATGEPESMLRCAECGVHLPASQALPGKGGVFCSGAHRERFEARE